MAEQIVSDSMQWPANNTFWRLMGCSETQRLLEVEVTKRTSFHSVWMTATKTSKTVDRELIFWLTASARKCFLYVNPQTNVNILANRQLSNRQLKIGSNRSWSTINPLKTSRIGLLVPFTRDFQIYNWNWCVTESSTYWLPGLVTLASAVGVCTLKSGFCHAIWPRIA